MSAQITVNDMAESLTGYDEIAIQKHFGIDIYADGEQKGVVALRALVFIQKTREGLDVKAAKDAAMSMPLKACNEFFLTEQDGELSQELGNGGFAFS
jgi:hypothetical protein